MNNLKKLQEIRKSSKDSLISGLSDSIVSELLEQDSSLAGCVEEAFEQHQYVQEKYPDLEKLSEKEKIQTIQEGIVNFYSPDTVNPYIPLAAKGPWIVTSSGAVLHDSGGYGMLGFGHDPSSLKPAFSEHRVIANIMTPSYLQYELTNLLKKEIGHTRKETLVHNLDHFVFLNSGSEASGFALRMSDAKAKEVLSNSSNKKCKFLTFKNSFHGRTEVAARVSSSTLPKYEKHLESFKRRESELLTVEINSEKELKEAFLQAEKEGVFIQAAIFEPVMGEGRPGAGMTPSFYRLARKLTKEHGSSFIIDSIQAGLRTHGCLSVLDYPGFEEEEAPDCEVYSKALNAGQYPLSVVAMTKEYASYYQVGLYGNTMTANPRALGIACRVLEALTPAIRENIEERGKEFLEEGLKLKSEYEWLIDSVEGTGLLFCLEINKKVIDVVGEDGLETKARKAGIGVIHGGTNALRFTPWFGITSLEVKLIYNRLREVFDTLRS